MHKVINIKTHRFSSSFIAMSVMLSIVSIFFLSACSGKKNNIKVNDSPELEKRVIKVLDLQATQGIEAISPKLARYRAVLVGETHTSYSDHLNQLAVIKNLHKQWGKEMAVGLEFVQQPFQQPLDAYIAGRLSELDMLRQTQWYMRWKYDFRLYRPIFEFARRNQIRLIALNIPTDITKRISKMGLDALTPQQRQQLPQTIDKSNDTYKKHLKSIFKLHAHAGDKEKDKDKDKDKKSKHSAKQIEKIKKIKKHFNHFYEAQLAWDEGMAATAATYLLKHPSHNMVLLAGGGHMINRHGIPDRLERRINSKVVVVLNDAGEKPTASKGDFLLLSSAVTLPKAGLLGVFMSQDKKGVMISALMANSAAKKAGLKKGDIFLSIANNKVKKISDVKLLLLDVKPSEQRVISILRGNKVLKKNIILQ